MSVQLFIHVKDQLNTIRSNFVFVQSFDF